MHWQGIEVVTDARLGPNELRLRPARGYGRHAAWVEVLRRHLADGHADGPRVRLSERARGQLDALRYPGPRAVEPRDIERLAADRALLDALERELAAAPWTGDARVADR